MEVDLFRVVQEGLFNVFRRSGTRTAVFLDAGEDHVSLRVQDCGKGLVDEALRDPQGPLAGVGLTSIRERLRRWNGQVKIESSGDGALLNVQLPVHAEEAVHSGVGRA